MTARFAAVFIPAAVLALAFGPIPAEAADGTTLITQARALGGSITPGDVAGFPITISAGGSYRLGSNLAVPADTDAIVVNGVEVTIDLNGFRITGSGGTLGDGILGNQRGLTVRNGTIRVMGRHGISSAGAFTVVEDMRIEENRVNGINAPALATRVVNTTAAMNKGNGVVCGGSCLVQASILSANGGSGIRAGNGSTIVGNSITENGSYGILAEQFSIAGFGNNVLVNNASGTVTGYVWKTSPNICNTIAC